MHVNGLHSKHHLEAVIHLCQNFFLMDLADAFIHSGYTFICQYVLISSVICYMSLRSLILGTFWDLNSEC